ncbi:DNA-processing protein DprA [bacterium]|nr:DNA-processing protein DprA [bacterium]
MSNQNIKIIKYNNPLFPEPLRKIKNPPKILYVLGELNFKNRPVLAVVGTRRCSDYGKKVTIEIVTELIKVGFIIVSGLAKGIDTIAHRTTIETNGQTIAVLGSGIDKESIYPKENIKLAEKIINSGGAIISEYPPKTPAMYYHFPERNRIIAGLALGVLVIEAKKKSGALITADYAFGQKKPVFTVPGSIYWQNSQGCHFLIKKGAKLVESAKDILEEFNIKPQHKSQTQPKTIEEKIILEVLSKDPVHIDKIIEITKLKPNMVISLLSVLESEGKVKNLGNNVFTSIT